MFVFLFVFRSSPGFWYVTGGRYGYSSYSFNAAVLMNRKFFPPHDPREVAGGEDYLLLFFVASRVTMLVLSMVRVQLLVGVTGVLRPHSLACSGASSRFLRVRSGVGQLFFS